MTDGNTDTRKKRIQRLKKLIVATVILAIVIPLILSVILTVCLIGSRREIRRLQDTVTALEQEVISAAQAQKQAEEAAQTAQDQLKLAEEASLLNAVPENPEENVPVVDTGRKVYLTFDDGPSENTERILDILEEYGVKATFFVVAKESEQYESVYKRIVADGHTLGMHSYSHKYDEIYASLDNYREDLMKLQEFLYDRTGVMTDYTRFPGGSSNAVSRVDVKELIKYLDEEDIAYFDWNVESGDTTSGKISADKIVENCMERIPSCRTAVVLMHDAGDKDSTVEALPQLIEQILELEDTEILPIDDDTIPIHHKTVASQ